MSKAMEVEVILVGDELLKGERRDSHLQFLGREFLRLGCRLTRSHTVADSIDAIAAVVSEAMERARAVIVTGGLGPTEDDITRDGVARGIGAELEWHEESWVAIEARFASRGWEVSETNRRQAHFPRGAEVILNGKGTAPGFAIDHKGTRIFVLPGPPQELQPMFANAVAPWLAEQVGSQPVRVETYRTFGVGESRLVEMMGVEAFRLEGYVVSSLPSVTGVDIVLTARHDASTSVLDREAEDMAAKLTAVIGSKYYERGTRTLAEVVGAQLTANSQTVAVAESMTGGLIGKLLTDVSGSSAYFLADAVTYSDSSKAQMLGVRGETLTTHGAVSEAACEEMAHGIRRVCQSTWAIATTGIAGPTGATPNKPVGLCYIGLCWDGGSRVKRVKYGGDRADIRERVAQASLWMLLDRMNQTRESDL